MLGGSHPHLTESHELMLTEVPGLDLKREVERARAAARDWDELVRALPEPPRAAFEADMLAEKLDYGPRILCNTLRPHFITRPMLALVLRAMGPVMRALRRLSERAATDATLQDYVGMTAAEKEMAAIHPRTRETSAMSRMDAFLGEEGLYLVELNGECPTGVGYNERLFRVFGRFAPMRAFAGRHRLLVTDSTDDVLQTLLAGYREWGGQGTPRVAIVDWEHVVTRGEFEIFAEHFERQGVPARLVDPRALEMSGGRLVADGVPIDLVYRRLLVSEFLERRDECKAFEDAYRAQAACFVNNLRTKFLHKKLVFAALWEPRFQGMLSDEERALVKAHVPWTAPVRPGPLEVEGRRVDLAEHVVARQADLVMKPNDDYGGRGLVIGCEVASDVWAAALAEGLAQADDPSRMQVVQARIPLHQESFMDLDGVDRTFYVDLDPFFFGDRMHGFLTRVSARSVSNVSGGGGQIPTYVLE